MRPQKLAISSDSAQLKGPRYEWAACASPISFRDLAEGKWRLSLRAQDNVGLTSQTRCAYLPIAISGLSGDAANKSSRLEGVCKAVKDRRVHSQL